jgi:hypothetical protein
VIGFYKPSQRENKKGRGRAPFYFLARLFSIFQGKRGLSLSKAAGFVQKPYSTN